MSRRQIWASPHFGEDLEAKLLTPGQLLGYPWKVWGIMVQTSYWEGQWHQNWARSRPTNFFTKGKWKFVKNGNFLLFSLQLEKRREISGWVQQVKWCLRTGQQMPCWRKVAAGPFWPCFACPKLGDAGRTRVASKNRAVLRKTFRPQFSDFSLDIESAIFHIYQNTADSMARLNLENCGRKVFCNTVLVIFFPLEIRVHFGWL